MSILPYVFHRELATKYTFTSCGLEEVTKVVEFTPTHIPNVFNLGFGDLLANGEINDFANTNNGDIMKVLSTVIHILKDFTKETHCTVLFEGSTQKRTKLYHRILKTYFQQFSEEFSITALIDSENGLLEIRFDPQSDNKYLAFLVKRID